MIRTLIASAAVVSTLAVVAVSDVSSTESEERPSTRSADIAMIAEGWSSTPEDALAVVEAQEDFSRLVAALEQEFSGSFAYSAFTHSGSTEGIVAFTGQVPQRAYETAAAHGYPATSLVGGAAMSAAESDSAVEATFAALSSSSDLSADVTVEYDPQAERLVAEVALNAHARESYRGNHDEVRLLESAVPESWRAITDISLVESTRAGLDARYGGGRLEATGSGGLACTSGFNVITPGGTSGIATSGHCGNGLTHENLPGLSEFSTTFVAQHRGSWGDFQWHTSAESEPDDFYYKEGVRRDVSGVGSPSVNQTLCRYGHTTDVQCDDVAALSVCSTFGGFSHCRLVRMDHREAGGGDSGGPWYSGTTAYGFHSGKVGCGLSTCDVWARASYIDDALGVSVRTS